MQKALSSIGLLAGATSAFWNPDMKPNSNGLIELDLTISENKSVHTPKYNPYLQNLDFYEYENPVSEYKNVQIWSELTLGDRQNPQKLPVIFDTGSAWMWLGYKLCDTCRCVWTDAETGSHTDGCARFDTMKSTTFIQNSPRLSEINYGRGNIIGWFSRDLLCIDPTQQHCITDFLWVGVIWQDFKKLHASGLVGLSPTAQFQGAKLLIPQLTIGKAIQHPAFGLYIDLSVEGTANTSRIQLGGWDTANKYYDGQITWYPIKKDENNVFWTIPIIDGTHKIGTTAFTGAQDDKKTNGMIVDSGTTLIFIPEGDNNQIKQYLTSKGIQCTPQPNKLLACGCQSSDDVDDITFNALDVNGTPQQIVLPNTMWYEKATDSNHCVVKFMHDAEAKDQQHTWILGLNFFNMYYTVFDYVDANNVGDLVKNQRLGLAKTRNYGKRHDRFIKEQITVGGVNASYNLMNLNAYNNPHSFKNYLLVV